TAMAAECPELPPATSAAARVRELERELRLMGPVNPLALEEFTALQERHTFLEGQLDDVKSSRRELGKVIRAVDAEIIQLFAAAFDDVNLHRFLDLVHEFRDEAQLLVVTHQKRTMEAGDVLYGVTMQPGGSSRVVSQRVATSA